MMTAQDIIKKFDLTKLPKEGGYFRETYKCTSHEFPASQFGIDASTTRKISTAIYYLVTPRSFSTLHRVKSDEIFHFYAGDPVEMLQIDKSGESKQIVIGNNLLENQVPQVVVPKGIWQGTKLVDGGKWALMGTTVAPGFEFEDFELGQRNKMISLFPHLRQTIMNFTEEQSRAFE